MSLEKPTAIQTLCLSMDLIRSTETALRLSTNLADRLSLALVAQLRPHLISLGLENILVKFTGDGWLLLSEEQAHAAPLCCLAMILSNRFQVEVSGMSGIALEKIPALRLALCWARDIPIVLPNGSRDYLGDSVRLSVRASQFCRDNEILIDHTVCDWIYHDFVTESVEVRDRYEEFPDAKVEQMRTLYRLCELKTEAALEADAPIYYVNTLEILGQSSQANALAERISGGLQSSAESPMADKRILIERFNRLLESHVEFDAAQNILRDMYEAELPPQLETYNALISKAPRITDRHKWLQKMKQEGIAPDIRTFNLLIESAEDVPTTQRWLNRMRREGVKPDSRLLNTLLVHATNYSTAKRWFDWTMKEGARPDDTSFDLLIQKAETVKAGMIWIEKLIQEGLQPDTMTFLRLFANRLEGISGEELLTWYLSLSVHPPEPMYRVIAEFRKAGCWDDALRICLDYPYAQAAQKVFRSRPDESLDYFKRIVDADPTHANGTYALANAHLALGEETEAIPLLQRALTLATPGHRREEIAQTLAKITPTAESTEKPQIPLKSGEKPE